MNKRMKTLGRLLAAVTSLAILLSMTAFAGENKGSESSTSTASSGSTEQGDGAGGSGSGTGGNPTPPPTPEPTPAPPTAATPYLTAYALTNSAGGEVTKVEKGDRVNVVLSVVDPSIVGTSLQAKHIAARVNTAAFTYTGLAEVSQVDTVEGRYVLLFRDVIYNGGDNNFNVDISYVGSILAQGSVSHAMGQCVTTTKDNSRTPSILVRGNKITTSAQGAAAGTALAGNECTMTLDILSTSGDEALTDLLVTLALPEGVTLASGNSTTFRPRSAVRTSPTPVRASIWATLPPAPKTRWISTCRPTIPVR